MNGLARITVAGVVVGSHRAPPEMSMWGTLTPLDQHPPDEHSENDVVIDDQHRRSRHRLVVFRVQHRGVLARVATTIVAQA